MKESENNVQLNLPQELDNIEAGANAPSGEKNKNAYNEYEKLFKASKTDYKRQLSTFKTLFFPCFTDDQFFLQCDSAMDEDLDENEKDSLINRVYGYQYTEGGWDYDYGDPIHFSSIHETPTLVQHSNAFKELTESIGEYAKKLDETLTLQFYDEKDESVSGLTMGFLKAAGIGAINRMLDGHTNTYLSLRTPMTDAVAALVGTVDGTLNPDLPKRLSKNEAKYPLISIINGAEEHLQTLSDYWKEQEGSAGAADRAR